MAANLGQAFLGAAGIVPNLAQELATGNFHENRETFHDYIYSKLILGDDKSSNAIVSSPNSSVFPNSNLASSYPNALHIISSSNNGSHSVVDVDSDDDASSIAESKTFNALSLTKTLKSGNSKKKPSQTPQNIPQVCPGIGEDFTKLKKKSHHKKKEKTNMCDVCGRGFAEKYTLNRHMLTHTHIKPYSCTKCNMSFSRSDGLAKHMAAGYRCIDAHHCDICGGTFNSEVSFEQHRREYGNTLPFVCNLCMLAFSQCCHLNYHMKSHSLSKMNDNVVSESSDDKNNAIDVSELIPDDFTPPKKDIPKNSFTGFLFSPAKTGDVHEGKRKDSHTPLDPNIVVKPEILDYHSCQSIPNQIARGSAAQVSSLVNTSFEAFNNFPPVTSSPAASPEVANPHVKQSGKNLTSTSSLPVTSYLPDTTIGLSSSTSNEAVPISDIDMKKYLDIKIPNPRFHDGTVLQGTNLNEDGLFRCEICGKGFTRKYHMQRHVKLHIRGPVPKAHLLDWTRRPYACGVCKMGFTRQHHLTRHMLIHTGERPHSCHVCGKAFRRFTNLTLHVRTVHGAERPFKCHICSRGFPRLYSLQRHLKLHAKNAVEVNSVDQLYKGFKTVGTVNLESGKSPSYSSFNPGSNQQSPGHSRESISSEQSSGSGVFEQDHSAHKDSVGHIDSSGNHSPVTYHDRYALMQEENQDGFLSQSDLLSHKDQALSSLSSHTDDRVAQSGLTQHQQVMSPPDTDLRVQKSRNVSSSNDSTLRQKSLQVRTSNDFNPSPRPSSEPLGSQAQNLTRTDFNHQSSLQNISSGQFTPVNSISTQNMRTVDMSVARSFTDVEIRETKYSLNQRVGSDEGFVLHQRSVQSPHPLTLSLDRPGSRSMMSPTCGSDTYHQSQAGYIQSPPSIMTQQHANMDLSAGRTTMSPVHILDSGTYSRNHQLDLGGNGNGINDPPAYSHSRSVSSMSFPGSGMASTHGMYQQQLSDSMDHLDMRPNPSASPMPVSSHRNNIQY